jgi:ubiquinone/menaquinone biosynthesis C-methylase UbiE
LSDDLPFTGERFVPGVPGEIWVEHWHRYHFASRWAAGKRAIDVACGEGYGTALLAQAAASVTGVDVSAQAIAHARAAYAGIANASFVEASCTQLPFADASMDLAVSFETIEHIEPQERFLDELARVLAPDGVLLLSCPNKLEYSDKRNYANEFHVKELYRDELAALVAARFPHASWYGQRPTFYSVIAPEGADAAGAQLVETSEKAPRETRPALSQPLYFVIAASRSPGALAAVAPALSVLADRDDWAYNDYVKVFRDLQGTAARARALESELEALRGRYAQAQRELEEARAQATRLEARSHEAQASRRTGWRRWLK